VFYNDHSVFLELENVYILLLFVLVFKQWWSECQGSVELNRIRQGKR